MLLIILTANLPSCAMFFFVDARAGLFGLIVTTVRLVVYWGYSYKDKKAPIFILVLFILGQIAATFAGWDDWASALALALIFNTYGQLQTNEKKLRCCLLASAVFIGVYCLMTHAYIGAVNKLIQAISATLALYRFKKARELDA
jgi:hypothetical protein